MRRTATLLAIAAGFTGGCAVPGPRTGPSGSVKLLIGRSWDGEHMVESGRTTYTAGEEVCFVGVAKNCSGMHYTVRITDLETGECNTISQGSLEPSEWGIYQYIRTVPTTPSVKRMVARFHIGPYMREQYFTIVPRD